MTRSFTRALVFAGCMGTPALAAAQETASPPSEAKPTEARPTEAKPTEAKPTEAKPTEAKPTEAKPTPAVSEESPVRESARSVKLFDSMHSKQGIVLSLGPVWYREAGRVPDLYERGTGEARIGVSVVSTWKPFYVGGVQETLLRVLDSKRFSWSIFAHTFVAGLTLGPIEPEVRIGASLITVDIFNAEPSIGLFSPRVAMGAGVHIGNFKLDIQAHSEYLWRWFGPDYLIRGLSLGLRFDAAKAKNPLSEPPR